MSLITFDMPPVITSFCSIAGKKEKEGPLSQLFDITSDDDTFGQKTFEKAESAMVSQMVSKLLSKANKSPSDIDFLLGGDLLNQCIASTFGVRDTPIDFFGLFGACSTMAEGMILASVLANSPYSKTNIAFTSSHFCTAERQFRLPLEYGGQRTPTSQWTVTGSGGVVIEKSGTGPRITRAKPGKVVDLGITDVNNMGAAMAPAAATTFIEFFTQTGAKVSDYDLIATGDLATEGANLVKKLALDEGLDLGNKYTDCGLLIYDIEKQDAHAGGSGCGCSAVVLTSYILPKLISGEFKKVLFVGTGALMSPTSAMQNESIPSVAHLVEITM